jgi:hypothetical protein
VYPLSQGDWRAGTEQMREARAWVAFRPSDPTSSGYHLAARGYPVTAVAADAGWYEVSLKSLYGYFGHLTVPLPDWVYGLALAIFASNVLTLGVGETLAPVPYHQTDRIGAAHSVACGVRVHRARRPASGALLFRRLVLWRCCWPDAARRGQADHSSRAEWHRGLCPMQLRAGGIALRRRASSTRTAAAPIAAAGRVGAPAL